MSHEEEKQIKLCRECHVPYKKLSQKFCGNGCERKLPHFIDGKANTSIEPREILLDIADGKIIRWMCIACHLEFKNDDIKGVSFKCTKCGTINDLYPFNSKQCANCKDQAGTPRKLPIEAKACDLCGKMQFILNKIIDISKFKLKQGSKSTTIEDRPLWEGPATGDLKTLQVGVKESKNLISCTFTILNNNCEYILYGDSPGKSIKMEDIIRDANGFVPNGIYMKLIQQYPREKEIFNISFDSEKQQFSVKSVLDFQAIELDTRFAPKGSAQPWTAGNLYPIPESKLMEMRGDFFRIHLWVY